MAGTTEILGSTVLTSRQREIMEYLSLGCTNQEIARYLNISVNTVKTHVALLYRQLDAGNRTEAVHRYRGSKSSVAKVSPLRPCVAVVPFDGSLERGGDGTAHALSEMGSMKLARWGRFPVVSPDACRGLAASEVTRLEARLGVAYALTGALLRQQGRLALWAKLLSTRDGTILWTRRIPVPEVLGFPDVDAVSSALVAQLMPGLLKAEAERLVDRPDGELENWERIALGLHLLQGRNSTHCRSALRHFQCALRSNPDLAAAHYGAVAAHGLLLLEAQGQTGGVRAVINHAKACVRLDPGSSDALFAQALSFLFRGDTNASLELMRQSLRVNPCSLQVLEVLAAVLSLRGEADEAIRVLQEVALLSGEPQPAFGSALHRGLMHLIRSEYGPAVSVFRQGYAASGEDLLLLALHASGCLLSTLVARKAHAQPFDRVTGSGGIHQVSASLQHLVRAAYRDGYASAIGNIRID